DLARTAGAAELAQLRGTCAPARGQVTRPRRRHAMRTTTPTSDGTGKLRHWLRRELPPLLLMIALLVLARSSFANHYQVPSGSMMPALVPGDRVVVDMSAYGLRVPFTAIELLGRGRPAPGDVVVFKSPVD